MKGWREKKSKLVQRVKDYFDAPRQYFSLFILSILILFIIFKYAYSYPFQIDDESAMYFLSALVQSQAAILAIVITLTLIAVQLASSHYSPRVIDIFKKDPIIWWFLCYYGISIFFGLYILIMMQVIQNGNIVIPIGLNRYSFHISLEYWIYAAYWIAIGTFVVLFGYMKNVFDLLKPSNIIKKLSDNITKENILKHIKPLEEHKKDQTQPIEEDPIQPIADIIHGSVMKYDIATTRIGLKAVTNQVIEIIDSDGQKEISKSFCNHFNMISKSTIRNTDEESTVEVIQNLGRFGKSAAESGLKDAASKVVESLRDVGEIVAEKGFDDATSKVAESLKDVGTSAAEKGSKFENVTTQVAVSLGTVGRIAAKKELENTISQVVESLSSVGWSAAKNRLDDTMYSVALSLGYVGMSAAEKGSEFEHIVIHVAICLQRVCPYEYNYEYKNENVLFRAASSLGDVGVSAAENRLNDATSEVVRSLEFIGVSAAKEGKVFEHVVRCAVVSIVGVGTTAIEKEELKYAISEAAQSLVELTISSEEIVKNTIQELKQEEPDRGFFQKHMELCERQIRRDRDSFQKFMNLYEQRLEELRELQTRKPN